VEIPLLGSVHGTPRIRVTVDDAAGEMIVDTGAFATLISPEFAARATVPVRQTTMRSVDAGGNVKVARGIAQFDALGIGGATFYQVDAVVQDVSVLGASGEAVGGAIGMPVFRDVLVTFDYPRKMLVIEHGDLPEPNGQDVLPLRAGPSGKPMIPVRIGDKTYWALIDTGFSSGLGVPTSLRREIAGADRTVPGAPFAYYHGQAQGERARLAGDLRIGWHIIRRPIADIGLGKDIVLGAAYLKNFAITIDQRNSRVRFTRKDVTPIHVPSIVGPGFYVDLETARILVVVPNSGAARAGLQVGDQLVMIEGVPFMQYRRMSMPVALEPGLVSLVYERHQRRFAVRVPITTLLK
jgi:predicted aspartyl protease